MLNVLRFTGVFKKLQLNDLTKFLIGRLVTAERTALENAAQAKRQPQQQLQQRNQNRDSLSLQSEQPFEPPPRQCASSSRNHHIASKPASAALAGGGGLAFGNCSTLSDLGTISASASVQQQQQTVARELEENIEVSDCDQVIEDMSTKGTQHQAQAEAIKAAAAAAAASASSSSNESCPGASSPADIIKFLELVGSLKVSAQLLYESIVAPQSTVPECSPPPFVHRAQENLSLSRERSSFHS